MGAALALPLAWFVVHFGQLATTPLEIALWSGSGIFGAAFLLSWTCEAAQLDITPALALALLALIAVLPQSAVDVSFAWHAGQDSDGGAGAGGVGGGRGAARARWAAGRDRGARPARRGRHRDRGGALRGEPDRHRAAVRHRGVPPRAVAGAAGLRVARVRGGGT